MKNFVPWAGGASPLSDAEVWVRAICAYIPSLALSEDQIVRAADQADLIVAEYRKRAAVTVDFEKHS